MAARLVRAGRLLQLFPHGIYSTCSTPRRVLMSCAAAEQQKMTEAFLLIGCACCPWRSRLPQRPLVAKLEIRHATSK